MIFFKRVLPVHLFFSVGLSVFLRTGMFAQKNKAMKIYDTLEVLEQKIDQLIEKLEGELIKFITAYQFYLNAYYSIFKV